jgi:general secretion pathway protein D
MNNEAKLHMGQNLKLAMVIVLCLGISACANLRSPASKLAKQDQEIFNKPLREPKVVNSQTQSSAEEEEDQTPGLKIAMAPRLSLQQKEDNAKREFVPKITDGEVNQLAFSDLPVATFINEIFGNQLGLNFVIEPSISSVPDLVTMRIAKPVSKKGLYSLAVDTLKNYGVVTSARQQTLVFDFAANAIDGSVPLLITGRTLPDVPASSRPVFHIYPLASLRTTQVRSTLLKMFPSSDITIEEDITQNALALKGRPGVIQQVVAAANILDRPSMAGKFSAVIKPTMTAVSELAINLESVLKAEGYEVKQGSGAEPIRLLPLESIDQLVVFAKSREVLSHVLNWARLLETERQSKIEEGLFTYQVESTQATKIVETLDSLGITSRRNNNTTSNNRQGNQNTSQQREQSAQPGRYAVNEQLNMILFSGSGKEWLKLLPVIKELDRPAPSVLVEVILAEVQLGEEENSGVEWLFRSSLEGAQVSGGTLGNLIGESGTSLGLNIGKLVGDTLQTRAVLNFLYSDRNVTIHSRPRVMVKSGSEASINVVTEIPIVTSNGQSVIGDNSPVIQQFAYRNTGVLLDIKPTVHATGYVDIEINQELSQQANTDGSATNPTILNRNIDTTVTLKDGGSVLIGGLISSSTTQGERGVPLLGKLPVLGNLFSADNSEIARTELMIMIIPYVLSTPEEAEALGDDLQLQRMELINNEY